MTFTVMTWNVENLYRPGQHGRRLPAETRRPRRSDQPADPDAIGLQEMGDPQTLDDLSRLLDGDWQGQACGRPDSRSIRVAWLGRQPISDAVDIVDLPAPL